MAGDARRCYESLVNKCIHGLASEDNEDDLITLKVDANLLNFMADIIILNDKYKHCDDEKWYCLYMLVNNTCLPQLLMDRIEKLIDITNLCHDLDDNINGIEDHTTQNYRDYKDNLLLIIEKYSIEKVTSWIEFCKMVYKHCHFLVKNDSKDKLKQLATLCMEISLLHIQQLSAK